MASGTRVPCGPCMYEDATKDAKRWCSNCKEGLCEDCEKVHRKSKISRKHKVISIEDYRKIENVSISQVCEQHGENLEWFCKTHDEVLCMVCVPSEHKACSDIISINVASKNARQSTALSDLEEAIEGTLRNVKQCIMNRESATKDIEKQELAIKTTIRETRTKIDGHLDNLQEKLLRDIKSTSCTCRSKYTKFLQKLNSTEEMLTKLREQTLHMKQFSSDIQVFLGTRQVNQQIASEVEYIKSEIGATKDYELKLAIHSLIEKISIKVEEFGQIKVVECTGNVNYRDQKMDQAQIGINVRKSKNISDVKLQLIKTFQIQRKNEIDISGCVILPNGHLLIANNTQEKYLIVYSDTGEHIRDIPVSARPFDITVIDSNRIVVTYTDTKFIEIMNSNSFNVEKRIKLKNSCFGISIEDGRLYITRGNTIHILDLSGTQLETLKVKSDSALYITTSRDRIFYTDCANNSVHCCSLEGEDVWQFNSESIACPYDVAVDNYNNVYVVGFSSNNLTIIQQDGKDSKTLLTESDGLDMPSTVYYGKEKRTLLICNENGKVVLYKARYKVI
ncbi:E3 ubiquitin-protein ligase TRIM22-like [Mytilus californianus]|uniref:E3 ubiquitin-protein ligase TRIM22-like n=1 Tax=Mytilus californianus TaxID=6549 RepID=UPI00224584D1|nr:E3 ubiquitin-protein ligase TRIM22-like [Mytilus californianus]